MFGKCHSFFHENCFDLTDCSLLLLFSEIHRVIKDQFQQTNNNSHGVFPLKMRSNDDLSCFEFAAQILWNSPKEVLIIFHLVIETSALHTHSAFMTVLCPLILSVFRKHIVVKLFEFLHKHIYQNSGCPHPIDSIVYSLEQDRLQTM